MFVSSVIPIFMITLLFTSVLSFQLTKQNVLRSQQNLKASENVDVYVRRFLTGISFGLLGFNFYPTYTLSNFATTPKVHAASLASNFQGKYEDLNHPGCLREITVTGNKVVIRGSDSTDGKDIWVINAIAEGSDSILVDFTPKGGPKDLLGKFSIQNNRIEWPDGNYWVKK